jgi:hypothetical protein
VDGHLYLKTLIDLGFVTKNVPITEKNPERSRKGLYYVSDNFIRYWLKAPMKGHFFGVHLNIGAFNIAVDNKNRYQSPDGFYGVGLSYGYVLPFARHWAAEFTVGAGYVHTKYDTYYNIPNGARFEKGRAYNYWGLTKVGINLLYRFGK